MAVSPRAATRFSSDRESQDVIVVEAAWTPEPCVEPTRPLPCTASSSTSGCGWPIAMRCSGWSGKAGFPVTALLGAIVHTFLRDHDGSVPDSLLDLARDRLPAPTAAPSAAAAPRSRSDLA